MFIKIGESLTFQTSDIHPLENVLADVDLVEKFTKYAKELKAIAPKADDFLYFSCIMMHAAEAAILNPDGSLKKDAKGKDLTASWEKKGESLRWVCSDPGVKALKNNNGDIFPELELIAAHKKWVGKPLCLDHKSDSVDMIRGLIVDTHYDHKLKRVIALCALDKKNYPDLARKVSTGYAACVSMGTGVEKAVCYDCGTVARAEKDFCKCMRSKQSYGEINVGLNPIELSIVVNGADPNAKIRHIIAAANSIAQYVETKELELSKKALDTTEHQKLKDNLDATIKQLQSMKDELSKVEQEEKQEMEAQKEAPVENKEVSAQSLSESLQKMASRLDTLSEQVNKLYQFTGEDLHMTTEKKAYFQGGGDVNEPTPKQVKYPKEDNESIRNTEDKQMVGQSNTGPVDGMHPGYESFGESEEQRKRRLQRLAEAEARELRRQAALSKAKETLAAQKQAYFQGGGDVNEPTPGKPKYPKEDADSIRDKEDKQMQGQPPFPAVGAVDGLHPSPASAEVKDELKRKQMLARASKVSAKFERVTNADGSKNLGDSFWKVLADDQIVLTAKVRELAGKDQRVDILYDSIASKNFGQKLISKVLSDGLDGVKASLEAETVKKAQEMPAPAAPPAMPVTPEVSPAPQAPMMEEPKDKGGNGDPSKNLKELVESAQNVLVEIGQGVDTLTGDTDNDLKSVEEMSEGGQLSPSVASKIELGRKIRNSLKLGFKVAKAELTDMVQELTYAQELYNNKETLSESQMEYLNRIASVAVVDGRKTVAESINLMKSFVKYAGATSAVIKEALAENPDFMKTAQQVGHDPTKPIVGKVYQAGDPFMPLGAVPGQPYTEEMLHKNYPHLVAEKTGLAPAKPAPSGAGAAYKAPAAPAKPAAEGQPVKPGEWRPLIQGPFQSGQRAPGASGMVREMTPAELAKDKGKADDECMVDDQGDLKMKPDGSLEGTPEEMGKAMKESKASFDLSTKEGRAAYRAKQAEKAMAYSDLLGKAHKGGTVLNLEMKPADNQGKVETLEEVQKVMMDVATAPVKVKKAAEKINLHIVAGTIKPEDLDSLVSQGLDKDAVAYWKKFYGEAKDGGSEFANELVKDYSKTKSAAEGEAYRVKLARAYEVAYTMVRKGMCKNEQHAISEQVNDLMKYNDEGFNHFKNYIEKSAVVKTASMPQMGMVTEEILVPVPTEAGAGDLADEYAKAFSSKRY